MWVQVGSVWRVWWVVLVPQADGLIVTVLQNLVILALGQWDRGQTWAILCYNLALGCPGGLRFLLYKTMGG